MVDKALRNIPVLDDSMREHDGLFIYGHGLVIPYNGSIKPLVIVSNTHRMTHVAPTDLEPFIADFLQRHLEGGELVACVHYSPLESLNVARHIHRGNEGSFPKNTKGSYHRADSKARKSTRNVLQMTKRGNLPSDNGFHDIDCIDLLVLIR